MALSNRKLAAKDLERCGGGVGGVSSWNDLTDKPFGDGVKVLFDGELTEWESVMGGTRGSKVLGDGSLVPYTLSATALGKTYELTAKQLGSMTFYCADGDEEPTLITIAYTDEGKEIQIVLSVDKGNLWALIMTELTSNDTYTGAFRIAITAPEVNKLNWKYLPLGVLEGTLADDGETVVMNEGFVDQLMAAMSNGSPMILVLRKSAYDSVILRWETDAFRSLIGSSVGRLVSCEVGSNDYATWIYTETAYTLTAET